MNQRLLTLNVTDPKDHKQITSKILEQAVHALEQEQVLFFPQLTFSSPLFSEKELWSEKMLHSTHKNVSYNYSTQKLGKLNPIVAKTELAKLLRTFMHQYAEFAKDLINTVLPSYSDSLIFGRTSYRPAKITEPAKSKRKDDTRLHVDSFSATPVYGNRILRVFTNINPNNQPRVWHLGESFEHVLNRFSPNIPSYSRLTAHFLKLIKTTKTLRSPYDHYQIHLHDCMKRDDAYQQSAPKDQIDFPTNSSWIVFTDQVSHAALSGQFLLEQTFYLPISAMNNPELSPFRHWEKIKGLKPL